ncbi:hypothetical protein BDZ91DRAFT_715175 [Kalaharituber pfeilii]|nr:hypothetical protein BDZ91DRAFT_715175 [Kalaharituber pfeilii]
MAHGIKALRTLSSPFYQGAGMRPRTPFRSLFRLRPFGTAVLDNPESLLHRKYQPLPETLSPTNAHLLTISLAPYLTPSILPPTFPTVRTQGELHPGYYLAYFPPMFLHESNLLPDGSDSSQSPGGVDGGWPRRMWAGGEVEFAGAGKEALRFGEGAVCEEEVIGVDRKGSTLVPGGGKVFVWFERRYYGGVNNPYGPRDGDGGWDGKKPAVKEKRCLVFMRGAAELEQIENSVKKETRIVKPPNPATFTLTFHPTAHLLFRFSALTFNAHKIHYDTVFASSIERYRATICHGPLSQVFLLELLRMNMDTEKFRVRRFEYRNLAPMFCGEKYTIAGRLRREGDVQVEEGGGKRKGRVYDLWAETPDGGLGVKAMATVEEI